MVRILSFLLTPLEMSVFIGRLLVLFYIIAIPAFLGLYGAEHGVRPLLVRC